MKGIQVTSDRRLLRKEQQSDRMGHLAEGNPCVLETDPVLPQESQSCVQSKKSPIHYLEIEICTPWPLSTLTGEEKGTSLPGLHRARCWWAPTMRTRNMEFHAEVNMPPKINLHNSQVHPTTVMQNWPPGCLGPVKGGEGAVLDLLGEKEPVSFLLQTLLSQMELVLFTHIHKYSFTAWVNAGFQVTALKSHPALSTHPEHPSSSPALHRSTAKQHRCMKKPIQAASKHGSFLQLIFRVCSPGTNPSPRTREEEIT